MENNNEVRFKKIPLQKLIDVLVDIFERGADYVDIVGVPNVEQDYIGIIVNIDYFTEEDSEDIDSVKDNKQPISERKDIGLTDEDLNQLT